MGIGRTAMRGRGVARSRLAVWITMLMVGSLTCILGSALPGTSETARVPATEKCTLMGSPRADLLIGTRGRDVICGAGGADVIKGHAGNDVLRGGSGGDRVMGGDGQDVLHGGRGSDRMVSGDGDDLLSGEDDADTMRAGNGRDVLAGGPGDDDLAGGRRGDDIDGGSGTNWCTIDKADTVVGCVADLDPAAVASVAVSPGSIDLTGGPQVVLVRAHLNDDSGVRRAEAWPASPEQRFYPHGELHLVEGDRTNGWWEGELTFTQWLAPASYEVKLAVWDRVDRETFEATSTTIDVQNANPDVEPPAVTLLTPSPVDTIDVRNQAKFVVIKARVTDALSGLGHIRGILWNPVLGFEATGYSVSFSRVSGDVHDMLYRGTARIPRSGVSGNWSIEIVATDKARQSSHWDGPDYFPHHESFYDARAFPDGMGRIPVRGVQRVDTTPPRLESSSVSPTQVDTLSGPATVHLTAALSDAGSGVRRVIETDFVLNDPGQTVVVAGHSERTSGSRFNGGYEGDIVFPQGTPPGTYHLRVRASDTEGNRAAYYFDTWVTVTDSTSNP
jgi:hypothetical protein